MIPLPLPVHFGQLSLSSDDKTQMGHVMDAAIAAPIMANEPMDVTRDILLDAASQVHELGQEVSRANGDAAYNALHNR